MSGWIEEKIFWPGAYSMPIGLGPMGYGPMGPGPGMGPGPMGPGKRHFKKVIQVGTLNVNVIIVLSYKQQQPLQPGPNPQLLNAEVSLRSNTRPSSNLALFFKIEEKLMTNAIRTEFIPEIISHKKKIPTNTWQKCEDVFELTYISQEYPDFGQTRFYYGRTFRFELLLTEESAPTKLPIRGMSVNQAIQNMLTSNEMSDIKIICQNEEIRCHKFILCARSDVFKAMLEGNR